MCQRGRRWVAALVDMQIHIETAFCGEAKDRIEKRVDIVEQPAVNAADSARCRIMATSTAYRPDST